jgi:hypothetical protein
VPPDSRRGPGGGTRAGQTSTLQADVNPDGSGGRVACRRVPPPDLVRDADIETLVLAIADTRHDAFAILDHDGDLWFRCPRGHHYIRSNMGPARVVDHWRWTCSDCGADGTRYELERIILESSRACVALQNIVADRIAVAS